MGTYAYIRSWESGQGIGQTGKDHTSTARCQVALHTHTSLPAGRTRGAPRAGPHCWRSRPAQALCQQDPGQTTCRCAIILLPLCITMSAAHAISSHHAHEHRACVLWQQSTPPYCPHPTGAKGARPGSGAQSVGSAAPGTLEVRGMDTPCHRAGIRAYRASLGQVSQLSVHTPHSSQIRRCAGPCGYAT